MSERWHFLSKHLDLPAASGVEDAKWELFQYQHLNDEGLFRIEKKSRQIAWSFLIAAEAVAFALLDDKIASSSIFTSINQNEASEKINYARAVLENLKGVVFPLPRIVKDSQTVLEFSNGAKIISLPARPPRGKARHNFYGDEFGHVQQDKKIYAAALPIISKGGRIRLGSSPFGARGVFWEVFTESMQKYAGYTRKSTPWWEVQSFCNNVVDAMQDEKAMQMPTAERVAQYGKERIKMIFENMTLEDFQQEYECHFGASSQTLLSWDNILAMQDEKLFCRIVSLHGDEVLEAINAIHEVAHHVCSEKLEQNFFLGVDIGRTRDATEIILLGASEYNSTLNLRLIISLTNTSFDRQYEVLNHLLNSLPVISGKIDRTGIGRNLTEMLVRRFRGQVSGVDFTNSSKHNWATYLKLQSERGNLAIPPDRDLAYQLHSIKRLVTADKNLKFDNDSSDKHHADKFWALALALNSHRIAQKQSQYVSRSGYYL